MILVTHTDSWSQSGSITTFTYTLLSQAYSYFYLDSSGATIQTDAPRPPGVTITLDKPFVYVPDYGLAGATGEQLNCQFSNSSEGYGVVPQSLFEHILTQPALSNQYPGLESCLLVAPSIIHATTCSFDSPYILDSGGDLTESTTITVMPNIPSATALPEPHLASPLSTGSMTLKTTTGLPKATSTALGVVASGITPAAVVASAPSAKDSSAASIMSLIASMRGASPLGSSEMIAGTPEFVVSGALTVPLVHGLSITGITTIISGTTNVIVSSARTVGVSEVIQSLPGSTTMRSGTLEVVIPGSTMVPAYSNLPGLTGSTTVSSGSTYVVVPKATTVPVVLGNPAATSRAGGNQGGTSPAQLNTSSGVRLDHRWDVVFGLLSLALLGV